MESEWEQRCERCGRCCYEKDFYRGEVYYTTEPCEYLDLATRQCKVYARRHERRPGCAPLSPEVLVMGVLPHDCPYVRELKDYKAPRPAEEEE